MSTQIALLRTLESRSVRRLGSSVEKPVDFRLVAATNRNLAKMVAEGTFREDLYYRLNVIDLKTPALKDHKEDIALLVARFIKEFAAKNGSAATGIDREALKALEDYPWPGNVRQLRNVVEKMCVLSSGGRLTREDIPIEILHPAATPVPSAPQTLEETEKTKILSVLDSCGGNKTRAAEELGISRRTLHRKLNEWGLK